MAHGLPVEGERGPYVGEVLVDVPTCRPDEPAADVAARAGDDGRLVVLACDGMAVGEVGANRLREASEGATVLDVMEVVPSTLRPSVPLAQVDERVTGRLVTTPDGVVLGAVDPSAVGG